jgi:hypothetical protein
VELVDVPDVTGADVGLTGRRELPRGRLHTDAVLADSVGSRLELRRLTRRRRSNGGDEGPGSKSQHRRSAACRSEVLLPRRERGDALNAGVADDDVDQPEGGTPVELHDVLLISRRRTVDSGPWAAIFSKRSASRSKSSAVVNRACQMAGLPARSANSRYQHASSRSLAAFSMALS